jgi:hypothetical protein
MHVAAGTIRAFYLYDVADTIDLRRLRTVGGEGFSQADLPLRRHTSPAYLQFPVPPLAARLSTAQIDDFTAERRVKIFDYGVISIRLSIPYAGELGGLVALSNSLRTNPSLPAVAMQTCREILTEIADALDDQHDPLIEDYFVARIEALDAARSADEFLNAERTNIAALVLGESGSFSEAELDEAVRQRFSFYTDDLTIVQWDAAVIYDRSESADAIEDILEFANSQLVELRTYDSLLDRELDVIYAANPAKTPSLLGRGAAEQAASLRYLIVDVLELTDRASNALKIIGDAFYARIYRAVSQRLALADWQHQIDRKLDSIGEMYRFANDQARAGRDQFLEIVVIVLIGIEIVIGVLSLHH